MFRASVMFLKTTKSRREGEDRGIAMNAGLPVLASGPHLAAK